MQSLVESASPARVAGVLGIVGHLAAAMIVYIVLPGLVVPFPALYAFYAGMGDHPQCLDLVAAQSPVAQLYHSARRPGVSRRRAASG